MFDILCFSFRFSCNSRYLVDGLIPASFWNLLAIASPSVRILLVGFVEAMGLLAKPSVIETLLEKRDFFATVFEPKLNDSAKVV